MHQMMPPAEFTGTKLTLKRFLAFVDEHVSLELIRIGESRRAQLTGVWTFARMDPQMASQIGDLDKLAIAVRAVVRLLARVQAHVRLEVMIASESFAALLTLERLRARVGPFVILQDVLVAERPMTNGTANHLVTLLLLQRSRRQ